MREATNKAWVLGSDHFKQKIANQLNRRSVRLAKGGDRKSNEYKQNNGKTQKSMESDHVDCDPVDCSLTPLIEENYGNELC